MKENQAQHSGDPGPSRRAWHSKSGGQSQATGSFSHAHHFQIKDSHLYDVNQNVHYYDYRKGKTNLEYLQQFISEGALYDSLARFPPPKCHPMTRKKILKIITDWIHNPHPRRHIVWLNGPVGAGKSAIAQTIAGGCSDEQLAASFFFLRNSSDRGAATRLFTTLAWQLAKNIPELLPYIESAIEAEPLLPTKSIDIQFARLIVQAFEKLRRDEPDFCPKRLLVIIDGVDECAPDQAQLLFLRLIGDALARTQIPLRFLICSRPEAHIQEVFGSEIMTSVTLPVLLDDQFAPNDDIRKYLEYEFARIYTERKLSPSSKWPPDGVIDRLVSKSSGQFIYASTVVKFIDDIDGDPRTQLDVVLKIRPADFSSPFAQLDQLYIQILSQQPDTRLLRDVFTLVIALRQPTIKFVCRRLRISQGELERKLRRLRSLVQISPSVIDTYHLSVHDFFRDRKRAGKYFIHPARITCVRLPGIMRPVLLTSVLVVGFVPFTVLTLGLGPLLVLRRRRYEPPPTLYPDPPPTPTYLHTPPSPITTPPSSTRVPAHPLTSSLYTPTSAIPTSSAVNVEPF